MYEPDFYRNERYQEQFGGMESMSAYTAKTFFWMFLGLMTTFLVALAGYVTGITIYAYAFVPGFSIITLVAELAVVLILSSRIQHLSVPVARVLFFAYAALTGVVFSLYFYLFDLGSLILVFAATAVYFAGLALYGYFTKTDLFRLRPILVGGLILLNGFSKKTFCAADPSADFCSALPAVPLFPGGGPPLLPGRHRHFPGADRLRYPEHQVLLSALCA